MYKDTNEEDTAKDYYVVKTDTFFKENGQKLTIENHLPYASHPYILDLQPTNIDETSSYEYTVGNVEINYEGISTEVVLSQKDQYTAKWTFDNKSSQDMYNLENNLSCISEYGIDQDAKFSVQISVSAIDNDSAEIAEQKEVVGIY